MVHESTVVTFSAILNVCRLFENQVYGVVHGLLMGHMKNMWLQAQSLFIKVKELFSGIYHTDMVEAQVLEQGAQLVALEGRSRQVWVNMWSNSCLDLHRQRAFLFNFQPNPIIFD
ncbi:unnamed protein product [Eruca vesicaria subsp. sativa]|uniref:Uncharacterized protein n=1 Tax=Eruca vesicaria subsp. sativa TaxID=29727 RepID=A0ABC8K1I8_ERUVS|nr:unnamed protein product [Eruca vesicaria subsp. sativa]